jgi:hypothetical protein
LNKKLLWGDKMKKGIVIILLMGLFLNMFASINLVRYDQEGNPIEKEQISDSKGNEIEVSVVYLQDKGVFYGQMDVIKEDKTVDKYVSYSENYDFYTGKMKYIKYENSLLYKLRKLNIIKISPYLAKNKKVKLTTAMLYFPFLLKDTERDINKLEVENLINILEKEKWYLVKNH